MKNNVSLIINKFERFCGILNNFAQNNKYLTLSILGILSLVLFNASHLFFMFFMIYFFIFIKYEFMEKEREINSEKLENKLLKGDIVDMSQDLQDIVFIIEPLIDKQKNEETKEILENLKVSLEERSSRLINRK